jgi:hypothetical protein
MNITALGWSWRQVHGTANRLNRIMGLCGCILTGGCDWNSMTAVSTPTLDYSRIANLGAVELAIHRGNPG